AHETARSVATLFETAHPPNAAGPAGFGRGELIAALTVRSDEKGAFRFEQLSGISFTVWGRAPGFGDGIKERAAPGDPVELFLPAPRELRGRVRDEAGRGVAATVRLTSRRLARIIEVQADEQGGFSVSGLGEGPFAVSAVAPGALPTLLAEAEAGADPIELTVRAPRRLEVRVVKDGQAFAPADSSADLVDAVLSMQGDHLSRSLEVKAGFKVIESLYPGELMLTAVAGQLSSVPTRVTLAGLVTQVTLVVDRAGTVAATVIDEGGQPVPRPTLELLTRGFEVVSKRTVQTGELAVFGPIGAGEYQLRANAEGYASVTLPVKVKPGETTLEVTMTKGTVISGRVIDEYGRPAPGVAVLITPTGDSIIADAEGKFSASVPSPGLYELHAHHSDWGGVDFKVQAPKEGVQLQLEPRGGAEITVTANGRRVEGASVTLFHTQGNFRSDRTSGADGVVLMRGLPPDAYTLVATHPDFLGSERQNVTLRDGELQKLTAELKAGAAIEGQVVDTLGAPVNGVTVNVAPRATEPQITDAQGKFKLAPLRPQVSYVMRATLRGYEQVDRVTGRAGGEPVRIVVKRMAVFRGRVLGDGQPLKNFRIDEHEVTSVDGRFELPLPATEDKVIIAIESAGYEPMMADRPNTPELGDFDLKRAPLITGVVKDEGGQGVIDAIVSCEACEQQVLTDETGHFVLGKPAFQREFTLIARKGRRSASKTVTNGALQGIELTLKAGVKLSGLAYLPSGLPASGVEISAVNIDRSEPVSVVTNEDGSYSMEVSPGFHRLTLALPPVIAQAEDPPAIIMQIPDRDTRLDFGSVPGQPTLTVRVVPKPGYALWLVRGEVNMVGNPPMELLRANYAQLVYQPHSERVVLGSIPPGRYTLVWSSFHAAIPGGPIIQSVDVPAGGEVALVR
ncbi:MAG: carboxypeptidase regulatory-like domain-containing protein, partial [Archangium sp.]|nr:carboxypeptidase regulatory-like domain-containing protein [Archangium sp.]